MSLQLQRFSKGIAAAGLVAAFAAPMATATPRPADLRSPDTRDAAAAAKHSAPSIDLRSPDTRDAGNAAHGASPSSVVVDLRSPDTRDAAAGRLPANSPLTIEVVRASGFHWSDAGIGAAAGAGLVLLLIGASLVIRFARKEPKTA